VRRADAVLIPNDKETSPAPWKILRRAWLSRDLVRNTGFDRRSSPWQANFSVEWHEFAFASSVASKRRLRNADGIRDPNVLELSFGAELVHSRSADSEEAGSLPDRKKP